MFLAGLSPPFGEGGRPLAPLGRWWSVCSQPENTYDASREDTPGRPLSRLVFRAFPAVLWIPVCLPFVGAQW